MPYNPLSSVFAVERHRHGSGNLEWTGCAAPHRCRGAGQCATALALLYSALQGAYVSAGVRSVAVASFAGGVAS